MSGLVVVCVIFFYEIEIHKLNCAMKTSLNDLSKMTNTIYWICPLDIWEHCTCDCNHLIPLCLLLFFTIFVFVVLFIIFDLFFYLLNGSEVRHFYLLSVLHPLKSTNISNARCTEQFIACTMFALFTSIFLLIFRLLWF